MDTGIQEGDMSSADFSCELNAMMALVQVVDELCQFVWT